MENYDKRYKKFPSVFGDKPEKILVDHYKLIDNSKIVLDIGAGQGRNTVFLAQNGYGVEALEPSEVGLKQIEKITNKDNLPVFLTHSTIDEFEPKSETYSAVLIFGLLQLLTHEQRDNLLGSLTSWIENGSYIFLTCFSTDDPACAIHKKESMEIGRNSFMGDDNIVRTYYEPLEIKALFAEYELIHFDSYLTEMHDHGDGKIHQHGLIEAVYKFS